MSWDPSNWAAALRQLVGYTRVFIKNGETVTVNFEILGEQMEVWVDDNTGFNVLNGKSCGLRIYLQVIVFIQQIEKTATKLHKVAFAMSFSDQILKFSFIFYCKARLNSIRFDV